MLFQCDSDKTKPLTFVSFQDGEANEYINGWHWDDVKMTVPTRKYTRVNVTERTVSMWNLTVEDEGKYTCVIYCDGDRDGETKDTTFILKVSKTTMPPPTSGQFMYNQHQLHMLNQSMFYS